MKFIPKRGEVLFAIEAATVRDSVADLEHISDAIVDAIEAGKKFPGDVVYHSEGSLLSQRLQDLIAQRFKERDWSLHFALCQDLRYPSTTIYVAGEGAHYLPVITQPS